MAVDFVCPKNNEREFLDMAKRLGYNELWFVYEFQPGFKVPNLPEEQGIVVHHAIIAKEKDIQRAKSLSRMVVARSSEDDRPLIESKKPNMLIELEQRRKRDSFHMRNSGLDQVVCSLLQKNDIMVGFSLGSLLRAEKQHRIIMVGRMLQNARLCKKFKVKTVLASFAESPFGMRNRKDMDALARILGLQT
jgi:RNase P/RNase MRP subunit p30